MNEVKERTEKPYNGVVFIMVSAVLLKKSSFQRTRTLMLTLFHLIIRLFKFSSSTTLVSWGFKKVTLQILEWLLVILLKVDYMLI